MVSHPDQEGWQDPGAIGRVMFKGPAQVDALSLRIKALEGEVEFYKRETETESTKLRTDV